MVAVPVAGLPGKSKTHRFAFEYSSTTGEPAVADDPVVIEPVAAGAADPVITPDADALPLVPLTAEVRVKVAPVWAVNRSVNDWL